MNEPELYAVGSGRCPCCGQAIGPWPAYLVVASIREWTRQHGRPPTSPEWERASSSHPSATWVLTMFGTWNEALRAAGVANRARGCRAETWTKEEIIDVMLDFVAREGRWPTADDWRKAGPGHPQIDTVRRRFGTWTAAKRAAGFTGLPNEWQHRKPTSRRSLRERARRRALAELPT